MELVITNCLACHAASLDDQLIMGLGNAFLDMTQDPLTEVVSADARVMAPAERAQWQRWADRVTVLSSYMMTDTVGVNSADNLILALMAHRDPKTLAWSTRPLLEPPPQRPLPVAVPPWWNLRKKHALFYSAQGGRGDQALLPDARRGHLHRYARPGPGPGPGPGAGRLVRRRARLSGHPGAAQVPLRHRPGTGGAR